LSAQVTFFLSTVEQTFFTGDETETINGLPSKHGYLGDVGLVDVFANR